MLILLCSYDTNVSGGQGVVGSNPIVPTNKFKPCGGFCFRDFFVGMTEVCHDSLIELNYLHSFSNIYALKCA